MLLSWQVLPKGRIKKTEGIGCSKFQGLIGTYTTFSLSHISVCGWWFMINLCNYWANYSNPQGQGQPTHHLWPTLLSNITTDFFRGDAGEIFAWQPDMGAPDISQLFSIRRHGEVTREMGTWLMCDEWCLLLSTSFPFFLQLNGLAWGCDIAESNKDVAVDQGYLIRMKNGCLIGLTCPCKCTILGTTTLQYTRLY